MKRICSVDGGLVPQKHWPARERAIVAITKLESALELISEVDSIHGELLSNEDWCQLGDERARLDNIIAAFELIIKKSEP